MIRRVAPVLLLIVLAGCGRTMMPTPCVYWSGEVDPFVMVQPDDQSPELTIFYATDRPAGGKPDDRKYKNGRGPVVRVGEVDVRLGSGSTTWEDLREASLTRDRKKSVPLVLVQAREAGTLDEPDGQAAWAAAINAKLATSRRKNINIYVHGANVGFYDSVVVAAEFAHFQGRDAVMIAFSWPTRQSPLFYPMDKAEAQKSIPSLAELIDFLAHHTDVEKINALGYSAGGPILAGALRVIREKYPDQDEQQLRETLKVENVVFASSDEGLSDFIEEDLSVFHDVPDSIRITVSSDDGILRMAGTLDGGRKVGDISGNPELSREELDILDGILPKLDVIDVSHHDKGRDGGNFSGHGYWYQNPWVATDVLSSMRWDVPPEDRGLVRIEGKETWYFPNDYPQRITDLVLRIDSGDYVIEPRNGNSSP